MSDALMDLLKARRSIRAFRDEAVPAALVRKLVEAASWAPSAGNRQDWLFTVVSDRGLIQKMAEAVRTKWDGVVAANQGTGVIGEVAAYAVKFSAFGGAPLVLAVSAPAPSAFERQLLGELAGAAFGARTSAAMAAQNLMLVAVDAGLGTCCLTGALAAADELKTLLGLKQRQELVCLVAVGYPAEIPPPPPRKSSDSTMRII